MLTPKKLNKFATEHTIIESVVVISVGKIVGRVGNIMEILGIKLGALGLYEGVKDGDAAVYTIFHSRYKSISHYWNKDLNNATIRDLKTHISYLMLKMVYMY